jgi:OPA family sugar phosphate sensor protein UhpC-like MFS transporter
VGLAGGDAGTGDNQHGIRHLVNAATERHAPEEGLPTVGNGGNDPLELRQEQQSPPMGLWQMLRTTMLKNPMIWLLGVSYVLVYLIRIALNDWGNIWLTESHGVNLLSANATVMLFEAAACWGRCSPDGDRICCSAASGRR